MNLPKRMPLKAAKRRAVPLPFHRPIPNYAEGGKVTVEDGPVMRPFEPSWRDKIGGYLLDKTSGSPVSRRVVEGLVGSAGLGNTGLSIADAIPGGQVLAMQEAAKDGDYKGAAMAIMPIPGARVAKPIKAYHGSPHSFDKFDLSKIGTGEGAQAYGHGLYFAQAEDVAKGYRDRIAGADWVDGRGLPIRTNDLVEDISREARKSGLGIVEAEKLAFDWKDYVSNPSSAPEPIRKVLEQRGVRLNPKGSMYEVNIHADPEAFLDWDKPLAGNHPIYQSEFAKQKAIADRYGYSLGEVSAMSPERRAQLNVEPHHIQNAVQGNGAAFYQHLVSDMGGQEPATKALADAGIPGIKYLDQGSRAAGDGSRNYVVFNDQIIEIARKYGIPLAAAAALYEAAGSKPAMASEKKEGALSKYARGGSVKPRRGSAIPRAGASA